MKEALTTPVKERLTCTLDGKTDTLKNFCKQYGAKYELTRQRITYSKWNLRDALTTPPGARNPSKG